MALNLISNFAANVAHRNLVQTDRAVEASLAKLSSGKRVVSAKDDAASLAIGSRLRAEVQALRQASVNAGQATSMLQIADGAMATGGDILVRMKSLAVQASSGQLSDTERAVLNDEFVALRNELERIANDTEFNGTALVKGDSTTSSNVLDSSVVTNYALDANTDGFTAFEFDDDIADGVYAVTYDSGTDVLTVTDLANGSVQSKNIDVSAIQAQSDGEATSVRFDDLGLTVKLNNNFSDTDISTVQSSNVTSTAGTLSLAAGGITIKSVDIQSTTGLTDLGDSADVDLAFVGGGDATSETVTLAVGGSGNDFTATGVDLSSTGTLSVTLTRQGTDADGNTVTDSITLELNVATAADGNEDGATSFTAENFRNVAFSDQVGTSTTSFSFKLGTGSTADVDTVSFSITSMTASALGIDSLTIDTQSNADTASQSVSDAIDTLNTSRAEVGANQNRLQFASDNLAVSIENSEAARSELLDLDIAAEISRFTSRQVLSQAGVSMLAQANQQPQTLLRLLQ